MYQHIKIFDPKLDARPLSYSSLKAFQKSPQHFVEYRLTKKEPTPALMFGNLLDILILTPAEYDKKYSVMPADLEKPGANIINAKNPSPASLEKIKRYNDWTGANQGKIWITDDDYQLASFLAKKTFDNEKAKDLLSRVGSTQQKMSWTHKATGLPMVAFKDMNGDSFIGDLKSAADGSPEGFMSAAYKFGYHLQAGTYRDGERTLSGRYPDYFFLVVETSAPYNVTVYKATADFIKLGEQQFEETMQAFKFCMENNLWYQGYEFHAAAGYHQLDLPGWAKQKLNK